MIKIIINCEKKIKKCPHLCFKSKKKKKSERSLFFQKIFCKFGRKKYWI